MISDLARPAYTLTRLAGRYAVCQLPPTAPIPAWAAGGKARGGDFCAITRTADELSIICAQDALPPETPTETPNAMPAGGTVAHNWLLLRVEGPFDFNVTGVLAALSAPLAAAGVVLLAVATYQTDYLLVKAEQWEQARVALTAAGHRVKADRASGAES